MRFRLICHMLFRRVQARQAKMMKLNLSVLEDVRRELETSQNISSRPILGKIRNYGKKGLRALNLLCTCDGMANFEQIWQMEYVFRGESRWTKQSLLQELEVFVNQNVIIPKEDKLSFAGDDFDRIYVKYFAREQDVTVKIRDLRVEVALYLRVQALLEKFNDVDSFPGLFATPADIDVRGVVARLVDSAFEEDIFSSSPLVEERYYRMIENQGKSAFPLLQLRISFPWTTINTLHYVKDAKDNLPLVAFQKHLEPLINRAKEVGATLTADILELPVAPLDLLAHKIETTENERLRSLITFRHLNRMYQEYVERGNLTGAALYGRLAYRYDRELSPEHGNNIGYLLMKVGDLDSAKELFELAASVTPPPQLRCLPQYNLAILESMRGDLPMALVRLDRCIGHISAAPSETTQCDCLIVPTIAGNRLTFSEVKNVDLLSTAGQAASVLRQLSAASGTIH